MLGEDASAVRSVSFSPRGGLMASGAVDGTITLWDIDSQRELATLRAHLDEVLSLDFSPDESTLVSASRDETVRLWDLTPTQREPPLLQGTPGVCDVDLSPAESVLAWGGKDGIRLVDIPTGREIAVLAGDETPVYAIQFSPDGSALAWGCGDGTTRLMDVWGGHEAAIMRGRHDQTVYGISFSRDGGTIVSTGMDGTLRLWDVATMKESRTLREPQTGKAQFTFCKYCVAMSPDGPLLASGGGSGTVGLWDCVEGRMVRPLGRATPASTVMFGADGSSSAASRSVRSVAFRPDGSLLASAGDDAHIALWDPATGDTLARWRGHDDWILSLAFSPAGDMLASGGKDRAVRLWDVATQREIAALTGHTGSVGSVCFQLDGSILVSADYDGSVMVWHIPAGRAPRRETAWGLTGSMLSGFDVVPLGKKQAHADLEALPRPMWSPHNPNHWLSAARRRDAGAQCRLGIVLEKQGRDEEAQRLHRQAASSDDPGQEEWAQRSRWRLEHLPWLEDRAPSAGKTPGQMAN